MTAASPAICQLDAGASPWRHLDLVLRHGRSGWVRIVGLPFTTWSLAKLVELLDPSNVSWLELDRMPPTMPKSRPSPVTSAGQPPRQTQAPLRGQLHDPQPGLPLPPGQVLATIGAFLIN